MSRAEEEKGTEKKKSQGDLGAIHSLALDQSSSLIMAEQSPTVYRHFTT